MNITKNKPGKRLAAFGLAMLLALGTLPQTVFAVGENGGGTITAFEPLEDSVANQTKPIGTTLKNLNLPATLMATVEVETAAEQAGSDSGSAQDSGTPAQENTADTNLQDGDTTGEDSVSGNNAPGSAADTQQNGTPSDAQPSDHGDLLRVQSATGSALALGNSGADDTCSTWKTVSVPVLEWTSGPSYDPETMGTYVFTPVLEKAYTLAESVELPVVTVEITTPDMPVALNAAIQGGTPNFILNGNDVSVIGFGGHEWLVIGDKENGVKTDNADIITLLLKNGDAGGGYGTTQFHDSSNHYSGSDLQDAMDAAYGNLSPGEQALVIDRDLEGDAWYNDNSDKVAGDDVPNAHFWPLSVNEANRLDEGIRKYSGYWWLRSPGSTVNDAAVIDHSSSVNAHGFGVFGNLCAIRPAFHLDLTSVLFASAASGASAKPTTVSASLSAAEQPTGAVKFTMEDTNTSNLNLNVTNKDSINAAPGGTVNIPYTDAKTGANKYVSAVLTDSSDEVLYYGKLVDLETGGGSSTASFTVPGDIEQGDYTLKLFNEEYNGDNETDFASTPVEIPLTVTSGGSGGEESDWVGKTVYYGKNTLIATGSSYNINTTDLATLQSRLSSVATVQESDGIITVTLTNDVNGMLLFEGPQGTTYILDAASHTIDGSGQNEAVQLTDYNQATVLLKGNGTYQPGSNNTVYGGNGKLMIESGTFYAPASGSYIIRATTFFPIAEGYDYYTVTTNNGDLLSSHNRKEKSCDYISKNAGQLTVLQCNGEIPSYSIEALTTVNGSYTVQVHGEDVTSAKVDDPVTVTFYPNTNYRYTSLVVRGTNTGSSYLNTSGGSGSSREFNMPDGNISITVSFTWYNQITTQPTSENPTVVTNNPEGVQSYQWYNVSVEDLTVVGGNAGTEEVSAAYAFGGTYDTASKKWSVDDNLLLYYYGFGAGDQLIFSQITGDIQYCDGVLQGDGSYVWTNPLSQVYISFRNSGGSFKLTLKKMVKTAVEGQTSDTYTGPEGNVYAQVKFTNGYVLVSDTISYTPGTSYVITFDANGGSVSSTTMPTGNDGKLSVLPTPTRSGSYSFVGWFTAASGGTQISTSTVFPGDDTVYAHWTYTGGSNSGGNDSGRSSTPTVTIPATVQPNQPTVGSVTGKVAGANTQKTFTVTDSLVKAALEQAQTDAKAQSRSAYGVGVRLSLDTPAAAGMTFTLERAALNRLVSAGAKQFELTGASISLNFDAQALAGLQKQGTGNVTLTAKPVTVKGVRNSYDIMLTTVKDGKTVNIISLGNGSAALSIPTKPGKNEAEGYLYAVYVDAKGNLNHIADSFYDANSGRVIFSTNHFSVYGVGYTAPSAKFTDAEKHWAKESIDYVVGRGLFGGNAEGKFSPDAAITRGDFVTALGRLAGVDTKAYAVSSFTDVKADSYCLPYIEWAYSKGIIQGVIGNQFTPDGAITRQEIAVILQNYAKATDYILPITRTAVTFADAKEIGRAYAKAVTVMQQAGIVMGKQNNQFNPTANATRAEASAMLHRYIKLTIEPATAQGWAKNDDGQYLYYKDGKAVTGTQTIDNVKYFFNTDGTLKTGWVKDDAGNWHFYSGNQILVGFWDLGADGNNKRYYFDTYGNMIAGKWLQLDGKWYYFYADGSLARSTKQQFMDEKGLDLSMVLNSRYFHIARAGEKADGKHAMTKDAAMGLVNYVGTRENVELNVNQTTMNGEEVTALNLDPLELSAEVAARPATGKQMKTIANLLWEIPEAKKSPEYQDFKANPTIGNASELISYAAEIGLGLPSIL
ncbi:S-layer homology domain-containing protein [Clostridium sp. KNHs216]|uniref:S-layer homology domain-containing protein n=1 Tax=Clostridium sp. KNHs216 TaxID=1550235 RepID=UPI00116B09B4|nr:S-layer homology domain-containing protein [Clostridium sp. KNHs216]TQI66304.1 S-layer family protein [Clostridium sp. KNHs216]